MVLHDVSVSYLCCQLRRPLWQTGAGPYSLKRPYTWMLGSLQRWRDIRHVNSLVSHYCSTVLCFMEFNHSAKCVSDLQSWCNWCVLGCLSVPASPGWSSLPLPQHPGDWSSELRPAGSPTPAPCSPVDADTFELIIPLVKILRRHMWWKADFVLRDSPTLYWIHHLHRLSQLIKKVNYQKSSFNPSPSH